MVRYTLSLSASKRGTGVYWVYAGIAVALFSAWEGVFTGCGSGSGTGPSVSGSLLTNVSEIPVETPTRAKPVKTLPVQRLSRAPVLEGKLDDPCWESAATTGSFEFLPATHEATASGSIQPTTCAVGFDDSVLYLGFQCTDDKPDRVSRATDRDGAVLSDDCVEMQFDVNGLRRTFLRFAVNSKGVQYDAKGQSTGDGVTWDTSWNPDWQAAAGKSPTGWSVEIALPLAALGLPSLPQGMRLDVALVRHQQPDRGLSTWCLPTPPLPQHPGGEHGTQASEQRAAGATPVVGFGELALGEASCVVTLLSPGELAWGRNVGKLTLTQTGDESEPVDVKTEFADGKKTGAGDVVTVMPSPDKPRTVRFRYNITQKHGAGELLLSVVGRSTHKLFYFARFPFRLDTLLSVALPKSELSASTKTATAAVRVNVADESRGDLRVKVAIAAKDTPHTALTSGTLTSPAAAAQVVLDLSSLSPGDYLLTGALKDRDGDVLEETQEPLRLAKPNAAPENETETSAPR